LQFILVSANSFRKKNLVGDECHGDKIGKKYKILCVFGGPSKSSMELPIRINR